MCMIHHLIIINIRRYGSYYSYFYGTVKIKISIRTYMIRSIFVNDLNAYISLIFIQVNNLCSNFIIFVVAGVLTFFLLLFNDGFPFILLCTTEGCFYRLVTNANLQFSRNSSSSSICKLTLSIFVIILLS